MNAPPGIFSYRGEKPTMVVVIAGRGPPARGAHAELALILATYAMTLGFASVGVKASRIAISTSRYVVFDDARARRWKLRISDHRRPPVSSQSLPHFDLVSLDGKSGLPEAKAFLDTVAAGARDWADLEAEVRVPRPSKHRTRR